MGGEEICYIELKPFFLLTLILAEVSHECVSVEIFGMIEYLNTLSAYISPGKGVIC